MPPTTDREPAADAAAPAPAPPRWALGPAHLLLVVLWGGLYLLLSYLPLRGTELWGHVLYGEWILDHRSLPAEDPVMPLAEGVKVIADGWLSQVILAAVDRAGGPEWLSIVSAVLVLAACLVLARALYLEAGGKLLATLGVLASLAVTWHRSATLRPESFGALCFAVLLWLIAASDGDTGPRTAGPGLWRLWLGVPLLFALWANLDGSFVYGLAVLGCWVLGRAIDVGWRTRSLGRVLADRRLRRWLYLTELGAAAALLNPYGVDLWLHALGLAAAAKPPVHALRIGPSHTLAFVLSWVVLTVVLRHGRRPMPAAHALLLAVFGALAATGIERRVWYGPVFALVLVPQLAELLARLRPAPAPGAAAGGLRRLAAPSWRYSLFSALLAWVAFALSPLGSQVVGRQPRSFAQLVDPMLPLAVTGYLAANPPSGLIFNPASWGHWLALEGPSGLRPFATSNEHLIPDRVRQAYRRVVGAGYEWDAVLERFNVDTLVLDRGRHQRLERTITFAGGWSLAYDDGRALVLVRSDEDGAEPPEDAHGQAQEPPAGETGDDLGELDP